MVTALQLGRDSESVEPALGVGDMRQALLAGMKPLPATQGDTQGAAPPQAAASTRTVNQMSLDIIALGLINSELDADEVKGGVCVCVCVRACVRALLPCHFR